MAGISSKSGSQIISIFRPTEIISLNMEESNDVQALEKISSEVDESQIKVILSSQCIKAQAFLLDKLKKQSERHKETCSFISSANLKVETEIKQAEHEIRSMLIAQDTIKSANVEIKKEWLLAKNRKADVIERVTDGKDKYEDLWLECKTRYETIPFVQKLLQARERQDKLEQDIVDLDKQITILYNDIESQRKVCANLDQKRCIELANFMVNEMPIAINLIKEKFEMINDLTKEIEQYLIDQNKNVEVMVAADEAESSNVLENVNIDNIVEVEDLNLSKTEDDALIPKLNLVNFDLDSMDVNLDQVKIKRNDILNVIPATTSPTVHHFERIVEQRLDNEKAYDYIISPYFQSFKEDKSRNFAERKLINILEDININVGEVYNIVKKVNPEQLKTVAEISAEMINMPQGVPKTKDNKPIASENIEVIDLTSSNAENIIIPPTQFLDITLSDDTTRKRVSFDLPSSMQINEIIDDDKQNDEENVSVNQTINSQLDVSAASDESYVRIKEMFLKKHNLDLSPQFVYAKSNVMQKKDDGKMITSKFFQSHSEEAKTEINEGAVMEVDEPGRDEDAEEILKSQNDGEKVKSQEDDNQNILMSMDVDDVDVCSPKLNINTQTREEQKSEKPVTGLLFTHGAQAIPDSLNVSLSTTGYEDSDFPHCIDSSLLLSPKADVPANGDNHEVLSQEVPNFLTGFRKTGLSFFGAPSTSSEPKPDSNAENEGNNNFSFNFGGEKKNRGGLFSLFR